MSVVIRGMIIALLAFYLYVVYLIANPDVSAAYREYYILKSTGLSIAERKKLSPLQAAHEYSHRDAAIGFDGWSEAENTHRWSNGKLAKLIFRLDAHTVAQAPQRLVVRLAPLGVQCTRWRLNATAVGEQQVNAEMELVFPLGPNLLREGENIIEIDVPDARAPGNGDPRVLGPAFKSLMLK